MGTRLALWSLKLAAKGESPITEYSAVAPSSWSCHSHKANDALLLAAIKSTRLVANPNRPEGISTFPVSSYDTTNKYPNPFTFSSLSYTKPATIIDTHWNIDHLVDWHDISCPCVLVVSLLAAR